MFNKKLKKYLFGALCVWKEEDWLCFSRFTQRQAQIAIDSGADVIVSPIFQMNLV